MDEPALRQLLDDVRSGAVSAADAVARLRRLPFADLGFQRYRTCVRLVRERLAALPLGTRVVTYHGFGAPPPAGYTQFDYFHPTFLYESLWDFGVFLLLVLWLRPALRSEP